MAFSSPSFITTPWHSIQADLEQRRKVAARVEVYQVATLLRYVAVGCRVSASQSTKVVQGGKKKSYANVKDQLYPRVAIRNN